MKRKVLFYFFVLLCSMPATAQIQVVAALCENKVNPMGVGTSGIHFGWELESATTNQYQTAYQLVIASTAENLGRKQFDVFNSNKVVSSQSTMINFTGPALMPAHTYYWKVGVWDKKGKRITWSAAQQFTTGLFTTGDWLNAKWIGYETLADSLRTAPAIHAPFADSLGNKCLQRPVVPMFRKQFAIGKKLQSATLFITGLGQYEVSINGAKVGKAFLAPGWTYFDKTVLYNTYDVTSQLQQGKNAIGALVGNGFYNINRERYFKIVSAFGMPQMICRLQIEYADGSTENIVSDESWKTAPSPITFSSIYGGEDYDAQLEQFGWNTNVFDDSKWKNALAVKAPLGKLLPEQDYPVVLTDSFLPQKIWRTDTGFYVYDLGQNISGIVQLKIKGKKGKTVKLVPAELVKSNGTANQDASGDPFYFTYTLRSNEEEIWQPRFTYYGFRYVQVEGALPDTVANPDNLPIITGLNSLHNRNANPQNGSFACSNALFNRIYTLINWAIKSNMQSVVTDCPHREKLSWLEQDYLMGAGIHYNYDIYSLYRQLVNDLIDAQYEQGFVPDIAPEFVVFDGGFLDSPEWGSSAVILPWLLYNWYGDTAIVQKAYPMMEKYVAYLESKSNNHILTHGLGDWFDYGPKEPGEAQLTPKALTATAIYYYDVSLLGKMADVLHYTQAANALRQQALAIKQSFNHTFFNPTTKVYATGSQTAMAMPLHVGLVDESNTKAVLQNLVDSIYAGNKALTAGDIGFHFLVKALDDGGASQLLYDMNNRDDVPGYGFQLKKGATALTESWPALENVSNNHLMLGHIMEWLYSGLAGIGQEDSSTGYKIIKIRPQPVGDITAANGSFHTPYGWVSTSWTKNENGFALQTQIPVNTTANIYVPATATSSIFVNGKKKNDVPIKDNAAIVTTGSGKYLIEVK
ncbi:family 78 glycoside hydrolase catalytic domain [Limnovirga soli]|uniref:alpha-L-rhamnosidase n=1 Tax=Limnovirga soli TaxID=2656915 RepID=A0A8J8FEZ8_9BACT|nr:family 78 glycoside hydrolase catalytic domain [Limnovirga soli]NNV55139.1 Bacterial alpha-L-rhamnosidase [Limnovirga soli]